MTSTVLPPATASVPMVRAMFPVPMMLMLLMMRALFLALEPSLCLGRQRVDGLYGFRDGLAAGERLIAERADQHHVLGEATGDGVFACAACTQSRKDSKAGRCWANVVMAT